jgi:hypothetical protein
VVSTTSDGSGNYSLTVPASGTYTLTGSKSGYATYSQSIAFSCPASVSQDLKLGTTSQGVTINTYFCGGSPTSYVAPVLTINGDTYSAPVSGSSTTAFQLSLPPGTYPYTITGQRMATYSGTVTVVSICTLVNQTAIFVEAGGYHCCSNIVGVPLKDTLYVNDPIYGTTPLYYSGGNWANSITRNVPACCGCPAANNVQITYWYCGQNEVRFTLNFSLHCAGDQTLGQGVIALFIYANTTPTYPPAFSESDDVVNCAPPTTGRDTIYVGASANTTLIFTE